MKKFELSIFILINQMIIFTILILTFAIYCFHRFHNNKKIIVSIEGNIGAGKSTLLTIIKRHLAKDIEFVPEPVDIWLSLKDENGDTVLSKFYQDKNRWSYTFQNLAFITRLQSVKMALNTDKKIIMSERSVFTDKNVFAKALVSDNNISSLEFSIYNLWFNYFKSEVHYYIYLNTDTQNCIERIYKRNRKGEENIEDDYLRNLKKLHDEWLMPLNNVIHIDGNIDFLNNPTNQESIIKKIKDKIC